MTITLGHHYVYKNKDEGQLFFIFDPIERDSDKQCLMGFDDQPSIATYFFNATVVIPTGHLDEWDKIVLRNPHLYFLWAMAEDLTLSEREASIEQIIKTLNKEIL